MVCEEIKNPQTEEEYIEYWTTEGALQARESKEYQKLSKQKEEKFKMIIELAVPWQRELISELIDDIKSIENARSSIEMYDTLKMIYNKESKMEDNKITEEI